MIINHPLALIQLKYKEKINKILSFIYPHVFPYLFDLTFSGEHRKYFKQCFGNQTVVVIIVFHLMDKK